MLLHWTTDSHTTVRDRSGVSRRRPAPGIRSGRRVSRGIGKHRDLKAGELYFSMVCRIGEPQFRLVHMAGLAPFLRLIEITLQVDELLLDEAMRIPDCLIV